MAASFISTVAGSLDSKGRVCIPASFRDVLTEQGTAGVYICPNYAKPTLEGFGDDEIRQIRERMAAFDPFFSREHDVRATAVLSRTQLLPRDENGRVRLPDEFIAHAGLKGGILFAGLGRKFQIWDAERYREVEAENLKRAIALYEAEGA